MIRTVTLPIVVVHGPARRMKNTLAGPRRRCDDAPAEQAEGICSFLCVLGVVPG